MATITTGGSGNWSSTTNNAPWPGGTLPTNADDVVIAKNHVLTLDTTTAVCKSITGSVGTAGADVGGSLAASTTSASKVVVENSITMAGTNAGGIAYTTLLNLDMSSAPTITCEIVLNNAQVTSAGHGLNANGTFVCKGAPKKRHTTLAAGISAGATSATVADATGWVAGDVIIFATTDAYASPPHTDMVTLDMVNTETGAITWTGGTTYAHLTGCPAGNFTSNLIFSAKTAAGTDITWCAFEQDGTKMNASICTDVLFRYMNHGTGAHFGVVFTGISTGGTKISSISNNAFYDHRQTGMYLQLQASTITRDSNIFYSSVATGNTWAYASAGTAITQDTGPDTNHAFFRGKYCALLTIPGQSPSGWKVSGYVNASGGAGSGNGVLSWSGVGQEFSSCDFWSNNALLKAPATSSTLSSCRFGDQVFSGCSNQEMLSMGQSEITLLDCDIQTAGTLFANLSSSLPKAKVTIQNKNGDPDVQEIYREQSNSIPAIQRDDSTAVSGSRSTSSILMTCTMASSISHEIDIPTKASSALKILLYVRKSGTPAYGASTLPFATLSGLGITPITATMSGGTAADTWELLTIDLASGDAPTSDGLLTLTMTAQSATTGAKVWFAAVPAMPFISRARHYGYIFDETSPTRTADITSSVTEATAAAYSPGQMTFFWSATPGSSTSTIVTDSTFQQLYDGHQAQAVLNVGSAVALTGAGVAGSPALFAQGDVTINTTKTLNGGGSLSIPSGKTLTADVPFAFTYTNGTYSKADISANATFAGGTLNIGEPGIYTFTQAASMTVNVTPTAPGNYAFGDGAFTGTLTVNNATAHAVVVEVPSGTSTATSTPAVVTFSAPIVTADISITSMPDTTGANNRLQIINNTALSAPDWQAATAYAAGDIVLRTSGIGSENTAGLYMRCTTAGTSHATTEPTWDTTVGNTTADNTVVWTTYAVLYYDADPAATSLTDTYIDGEEFLAGETVEIRFSEEDPAVSFKTYSTSVIATADGFSALVNEEDDPSYATYATSGVTQDSIFSPNFVANYIVLDTDTNFTGSGAYAYYCYLLTTSEGMYRFWGGLTGIDPGNIRNNVSIVSLYFDCSSGFVRQTDDIRIFRSDGLRPALDPVTAVGGGIEINWKVPVNVVTTGGSALTPTESAQLMALPSASITADAVWAKTLP